MFVHPALARRQRGAATVAITLALLGALLLTVLFLNRGLLLEARLSANQVRATVAFEAAEAGIDWALAMLNDPVRLGADCRADAGAATSFRERHLGAPLQAACLRRDGGWVCSCPGSGPALLPAPLAGVDAPSFAIELLPGPRAGIVKLVSTGCSDAAATCHSAAPATGNALSRIEVDLALVPALATAPVAALTARTDIAAGGALIAVHDTDPASPGVALHAGGTVDAAAARFSGSAGASLAGRIAGLDSALAGLDGDRLFVSYFGLAKAAWRDQPMTRRLRCTASDCGAELAAAIGPDVVAPLVWIDGDAGLDGPLTLGQPDRPVVIVVSGRLQLRGAVSVHGLVYANGVTASGSGARLHGALVSEADYGGDAAIEFHRDGAVLAALRQTGSYVKLPGAWRDF